MAKQSSNKKIYIISAVVVVLAIVGVGYKVMKHHQNLAMNAATPPSATAQGTIAPQPTTAGGLPNTDTSNQQLDQDEQNIQSNLTQLQQDQDTTTQDTTNQSLDVPQQ